MEAGVVVGCQVTPVQASLGVGPRGRAGYPALPAPAGGPSRRLLKPGDAQPPRPGADRCPPQTTWRTWSRFSTSAARPEARLSTRCSRPPCLPGEVLAQPVPRPSRDGCRWPASELLPRGPAPPAGRCLGPGGWRAPGPGWPYRCGPAEARASPCRQCGSPETPKQPRAAPGPEQGPGRDSGAGAWSGGRPGQRVPAGTAAAAWASPSRPVPAPVQREGCNQETLAGAERGL